MGKLIFQISTYILLLILSVIGIFYISCRNEDLCNGCQLSKDELAFICYKQGDYVYFRNDSTNVNYTLSVIDKGTGDATYCSDPCHDVPGSMAAGFNFPQFGGFSVMTEHAGEGFWVLFSDSKYNDFFFGLSGTFQSITVNGTTYDDVYSPQVNPVRIDTCGDSDKIPWKIDYSKSKGFIRFYMTNGQIWSKI